MDTIDNFPEPQDILGARGWFVLMEQASWAFFRAYVMALFWHLLKPKHMFAWTPAVAELFQTLKKEIIRQIEHGVKHFEPGLPTCVAPDYSGVGIRFFYYAETLQLPR